MSGLFLNFFECELSKYTFNVHFLPYENYPTKLAYKKLRETYPNHFFSRYSDKIYYWPLSEEADNALSGQTIQVQATDNPLLFKKILEVAFITLLRTPGTHDIYYHRYSHTWKIISRQNLLQSLIEGLSVRRQININSYFFQLSERTLIGIVLSATIQNSFAWTCKEFEENGIDTSGLKSRNDIIFANRQALKRFLVATGTKDIYEQRQQQIDSNDEQFAVIQNLYKWFSKNTSKIYLPDNIKIKNLAMKYLPYGRELVKAELLSKPIRFYFGGRMNDEPIRYYDQQVKKYKPYSYELFENRKVKIGVLCPKEYEGISEGFINQLERKLTQELHIRSVSFECCYIDSIQPNSYKEGLYNANLLTSDLVIVVVNEEHEKLSPNSSPYYLCKAKYIGNGIPTQDIQVRNIKNYNQFILNNITLNIYAKLGGTAWTIEKEEKRKEELVIGIGSTSDLHGRHILGIAQIFHSDGRYIVGNCAPLSTYENYMDNLRDYLSATLRKVIDEHIDINKEFRIIIHLFKSASNRYEIQAIEEAIQKFSDLSFKYALVHLGYGHNFRLFFNDGYADITKGTYINLGSHAALLHFVAKSNLPLYIQLDKRSTFTDLYYISKQVFWFSHLSHRSYLPAKKTVTITYPSFMARLTEKLKYVDGWDYDRLGKVSEKLWFI